MDLWLFMDFIGQYFFFFLDAATQEPNEIPVLLLGNQQNLIPEFLQALSLTFVGLSFYSNLSVNSIKSLCQLLCVYNIVQVLKALNTHCGD